MKGQLLPVLIVTSALACDPVTETPRRASVTLCWSNDVGDCFEPAAPVDGGSGAACLPPVMAGSFRVGDSRFVTAVINALPEEQERLLELAASGSIEFVHSGNDKSVFSSALLGGAMSRTIEVRARQLGPGEISLERPFSTVPALRTDIIERAVTGIERAEFVRMEGVKSHVRLSICSTLKPSSEVTLATLRGTLSGGSKVLLASKSGSACPAGYESHGTVTWTGDVVAETFTFVGGDGASQCDLEMPNIVTGLKPLQFDTPQWIELADGMSAAAISVTIQATTSTTHLPLSKVSVTAKPLDPTVKVEPVPNTDLAGKTSILLTSASAKSVVLSLTIAGSLQALLAVPGPPTTDGGVEGGPVDGGVDSASD